MLFGASRDFEQQSAKQINLASITASIGDNDGNLLKRRYLIVEVECSSVLEPTVIVLIMSSSWVQSQ